MRYLWLLLLLGCGGDFEHSVASLAGVWRLDHIEVTDNTGTYTYRDCEASAAHYYSLYYMDIEFASPDIAILTFPCDNSQSQVYWVLQGNKIGFFTGGRSLYGEIVQPSKDNLVIKFGFDYSPYYYFKR